MFNKISFYIGARYTRAKRRNHFISFISLASMLGIALGVMALITVLSVMNGFDYEIRHRILSMTPHGIVQGWGHPLFDWQSLQKSLIKKEDILGIAPFVEGQVMLNHQGISRGAIIKGIQTDNINQVFPLKDKIIEGELNKLKAGDFNVILGKSLAQGLGATIGDKVTFIAPEGTMTPTGMVPRIKRFTVVGIFKVGYIFDNGYAFVNMSDAAKLFRLKKGISGLQIRLKHYLMAPRVTKALREELGKEYYVSNWTEQHGNYFQAVKMEKTLMFLILTLIVAVAAFNLVSTLVMVVTDKTGDIAILRTMGATPKMIMGVFIVQGGIVGIIGTLLGLIFGILLALNVTDLINWIEQLFHVKLLSSDVYFISFLPSRLLWKDVYQVSSLAVILSLLATIYPAYRAAKVDPAEALRYE